MAPLKKWSTMSKNRQENEEALNRVFAWSNRAKSKLASSNAQKAKRERRKAEIELIEAKMWRSQGMATIMITEVQEKMVGHIECKSKKLGIGSLRIEIARCMQPLRTQINL